jgi:predicted  nucleic acid-binding Zn-ribbon protein
VAHARRRSLTTRRSEHVLNADPSIQLSLLELQGYDSALDRLTHQARTLPVLARIAELEARLTDLRSLVVAGETEVSDLKREQAKADTDVEQVRERSKRDQQRLDSGLVSSPKDLEALQHEIASLARRQSDLEDVELEVMERLETAQSHLDTLVSERAGLLAELETASAERDAALAELGEESKGIRAQREALAPQIPEDLSTLYEKLRAQYDGVGAAALYRGRCEGCRLEINPTEISRLRDADADEVLRCEECRRILVRTAESGL